MTETPCGFCRQTFNRPRRGDFICPYCGNHWKDRGKRTATQPLPSEAAKLRDFLIPTTLAAVVSDLRGGHCTTITQEAERTADHALATSVGEDKAQELIAATVDAAG
jgi:hypothetical protein